MTGIRPIAQVSPDDLDRLVTGYTSNARFQISKTESDQQFVLKLTLVNQRQCARLHG